MSDKDKPFEFDSGLELIEKDEDAPHQQGTPADFLSGTEKKESFSGDNRRSLARRKKADRREDIRFDTKDDRRSGNDRRKGHWNPKYGI